MALLSGGDAAFGVKVQEQIVPALVIYPVAQRNGRRIVLLLPRRDLS
jgi:hypothetical protein